MVSQNQSNAQGATAENEAHRFLSTDMELAPLIRGINDVDEILEWWNTVNRQDLHIQHRDRRRKMVKERMAYLKERNS